MIKFGTSIPADQREEMFHLKLLTEASGILNWMIVGFLRWRGEGFQVPDGVGQDTARWHGENDPLADFLVYAMEAKPPALAHERSADLYSAYEAWCAESSRVDGSTVSREAESVHRVGMTTRGWRRSTTPPLGVMYVPKPAARGD